MYTVTALSAIPEPRHEPPSRAAVRPHPVQVVGVEVPEDGPGAGGAAGGEAGAVVGRREVELRESGTYSFIQIWMVIWADVMSRFGLFQLLICCCEKGKVYPSQCKEAYE